MLPSRRVSSRRRFAAFAFASLFSFRAEARFPAANGIAVEGSSAWVRATFGLVASKDGGGSWRLVCDKATGRAADEDPSLLLTSKGTVLVAAKAGLAVSRDGGCTFTTTTSSFSQLVRARGAIFGLGTNLAVSRDDGQTFTPTGASFDTSLNVTALGVPESDPARFYVSATRGDGAVLLVSYDAGLSWVERPIALAPGESSAAIAVADPKNADKLWVRTGMEAPARLVLSEDAGKTWKRVHETSSAITGATLLGDRLVLGTREGIATSAGGPFAKGSSTEVQCLAAGDNLLWACTNERSGFLVGVSNNAGGSFEAKLRREDIKGLLQCPAESTVAKQCDGEWARVKTELGIDTEPRRDRDPGGPALRGRSTRTRGAMNPMRAVFGIALVVMAAYYILQKIRKR